MLEAPPGMVGLETALSLTIERLGLSMAEVFAVLSSRPARIARIDDRHGALEVGRPAHVCVVDPEETWTVDPLRLASRAAQHALCRHDPAGQGPPHRVRRRGHGVGRRRPALRWAGRVGCPVRSAG